MFFFVSGRCPKDRYIVDAGKAHDNVDWGNVNLPISQDTFDTVLDLHLQRVWDLEKVYVFDGFVGASKKSRRAVRVVTELAWHHHFCTNMFIRATPDELKQFKPDITIVNTRVKFEQWKEHGLRSETCVALDLNRGLSFVTGTEYSGEMKKVRDILASSLCLCCSSAPLFLCQGVFWHCLHTVTFQLSIAPAMWLLRHVE